ncbi:MAG: efflux RND transporter periplasmic adaptor subunit [Ginsengibacter sp.]
MKNLFILFTVIFIGVSCTSSTETAVQQQEEPDDKVTLTEVQMKNSGVQSGKVIQMEIASILKANGRIDVPPQNMVSVSVPLGGYLKSTKLLPGMHVNRGEVIATIEDNQYIQIQQDYLTAKAQFGANESEYNRQKELNVSKASSDKVYEQAKSVYITQRILIKSLEEKLKLIGINPAKLNENTISKSIHVYSPINGFVSKVNVNIGKYITPSDVLFELVNPDDIHLNLKIFEKDLDQIYIGQHLVSYTNSNPGKKYEGNIILISKDVSVEGITEVHCHFDNFDKSLLPGMYMNAEVTLKSKIRNVLPEEAVVRFEGKEYVFEDLGSNNFQMVEVRIGESEKGFTEIKEADALLDKKMVTKGAYTLLMTIKNIEED